MHYTQPVFKKFGDASSGLRRFSAQEELRDKHAGLFVMAALDDTLRVYALAGETPHMRVCGQCGVEGIVLGGGDITIVEENKRIGVGNRSMDFGSLPNNVLEDYFRFFWLRSNCTYV